MCKLKEFLLTERIKEGNVATLSEPQPTRSHSTDVSKT